MRKVSINELVPGAACVLEEDMPINDNGFPKRIQLVFSDVDDNYITQNFRYTADGYESGKPEYM